MTTQMIKTQFNGIYAYEPSHMSKLSPGICFHIRISYIKSNAIYNILNQIIHVETPYITLNTYNT